MKRAECWRTGIFKLWCWRRLLRILWTTKRSNQSILKEINPEYSLVGLMLTKNFQTFKLDLEKAEDRDQIANIHWIIKKAREFQKKASTSTSLTTIKPLTVCITANCGRFLKRWEYQTISPASWEICMQVKKQQLELDMEQQTGSKWERSMSEYIMWNARLDEAQAESRLQGKIPVTPDMQMTPSLWHKVKN